MIQYSQIEKGEKILINKQPYEIMSTSSMFKGRGHSVLQAKIKNLVTGEILSKTFHPSDSFEEAEISRINCKFLYSHRGSHVFSDSSDPKKRFEIKEERIKDLLKFLKPNIEMEGVVFNGEVININLPVKMSFSVKSAPPGVKGNTAEGGKKEVIIETGGEVSAPLFIEEGDIIELNTQTGEYTRRIKKR